MVVNLIRLMVIAIPLNILGFFVDDKLIIPSMIMLALIAALVLINLILHSNLYRARWREDAWIFPLLLFFVISVASLLASPLLHQSALKGSIQILGIACAILTAYGISKHCSACPELLCKLCRLIMLVMGVVALIGIAQFVFWNFFGLDRILNFSFMNEIYGKILWREPGKIGEIARINSILAEPAYMTRILGVACGLALVRLGIAGKRMSMHLSGIVPLWAALAILACYALSTSLLGYLHIVIVTLAIWLVSSRLSFRNTARFMALSLILMAVIFSYSLLLSDDFIEKTSMITLIADADQARGTDFREKTQSALAVAVNLELAIRNFLHHPLLGVGVGGHPISYYAEVSNVSEYVFGLNVDDAASLALRLLSETGLLGLSTFIFAIFYPGLIARRAIVSTDESGSFEVGRNKAVAVALLSSWIGLVIIYLARTGLYFDAALWVMLGLVAALPKYLARYAVHPISHV
jgi:hypothetical protein